MAVAEGRIHQRARAEERDITTVYLQKLDAGYTERSDKDRKMDGIKSRMQASMTMMKHLYVRSCRRRGRE